LSESATRPEASDRTAQGIILILGSVLLMAFADAMVKLASGDLTVWQIFATRSVIALPLMALIALVADRRGFRLISPGWSMVRSVLLVLTWLTFYASLPLLTLSVAAVAVYTNPIMIALLSAVLLGQPVTGRQWGGVLLGFAGVVTILRPGTDSFSWAVLLPLLAAALYAMSMVLTRLKCREESPIALGLALHGSFVVTGLAATGLLALFPPSAEAAFANPFLLGQWATMNRDAWGLMALLGLLSAAYFVGVARAYQIAPPQIIATFDYAYLVSATVWGFVFFAEAPDAFTLAGMVLITVAGLMVARR
jgi:drug/metabolite transporter (DMT)-like permease